MKITRQTLDRMHAPAGWVVRCSRVPDLRRAEDWEVRVRLRLESIGDQVDGADNEYVLPYLVAYARRMGRFSWIRVGRVDDLMVFPRGMPGTTGLLRWLNDLDDAVQNYEDDTP